MKDRLGEIFEKQLTYYNSLKPVIEDNDFHFYRYPFDIQDRHNQEHLRLLAWRLTEELVEVSNAPLSERLEEMADCLHFLVEMSLASGISEAELVSGIEHTSLIEGEDYLTQIFTLDHSYFERGGLFYNRVFRTIDLLGQTMNQLRQRPWRMEDRESDRKAYLLGLHLVFCSFVDLVSSCYSDDVLYLAYFRKSKINEQRQVPV